MRDHAEMERPRMRGKGKIERLIRTNNERLRADKTMATEKTNAGLARLLFILSTAAAAKNLSPFEKAFGRNSNA